MSHPWKLRLSWACRSGKPALFQAEGSGSEERKAKQEKTFTWSIVATGHWLGKSFTSFSRWLLQHSWVAHPLPIIPSLTSITRQRSGVAPYPPTPIPPAALALLSSACSSAVQVRSWLPLGDTCLPLGPTLEMTGACGSLACSSHLVRQTLGMAAALSSATPPGLHHQSILPATGISSFRFFQAGVCLGPLAHHPAGYTVRSLLLSWGQGQVASPTALP